MTRRRRLRFMKHNDFRACMRGGDYSIARVGRGIFLEDRTTRQLSQFSRVGAFMQPSQRAAISMAASISDFKNR